MAILKFVDKDTSDNEVQERIGSGSAGVNLDVSGGSGDYKFSIAYDPTFGGLKIDSSTGAITIDDPTKIDFEALVDGKLTLTIHAADLTEPENFGDIQVVFDVANVDGEIITGTTNPDEIDISGTKDFDSTDEEDSISGDAGDDIIDAAGGNDFVDGGDDNDDIKGNDGNDTLLGGLGDDIIVGGLGDDIIEGGDKDAAEDKLDGGDGFDTVSYESSSAAVTVDLNLQDGVATQDGGDAEDDILENFEGVFGSEFADTITGRAGDDVIEGGKGADILDGAGEDLTPDVAVIFFDTLSYASSDAGVTVTVSSTLDAVTVGEGGDAEGDKIKNFENIVGSAFADTLTVDGGRLEGGDGADILNGGADGVATYLTSFAGVTVTLAATGKTATGSGGHAKGDKLTNIESLSGSDYNDKLTGNTGDNDLQGGLGDDTLTGGDGIDFITGDNFFYVPELGVGLGFGKFEQGGNDTIDGGNGDDVLLGGIGSDVINGNAGIDTAIYQGSTKGVTIALGAKGAAAIQTGGDASGDKLSLVENIIGSDQADTITGNDLNNIIEGAGGADELTGGGGFDTVSYAGAPDTGLDDTGVTVDLSLQDGDDKQAGDSDELDDILVGFENVIGSAFKDKLTGDVNDNVIEGGFEADVMDGGDGEGDIVSYQNYFDPSGNGGITVTLDVAGNLVVTASVGTDAFGDTGKNFEGIYGSQVDDVLTGNSSDNPILGLAGDDHIAGGGGNDTLDGGEGVDTLDYKAAGGAVTVTLGATGKFTNVVAGVDGDDAIANFENVIGTVLADTLTGNTLDNAFQGLAGADIIDGNAGIDTVDYSDAAAAVTVTLGSGTTVTTVTGGDSDKISEIENVVGSDNNDVITGNTLANKLEGGEGDDTLTGGAGADTLIGGNGEDIFKFTGTDGIGDTISGGGDDDTIQIEGSAVATLENFSSDSGSIEIFIGNGKGINGTKSNNILDFSGLNAVTGYSGVNGAIDGLAGNDVIRAYATAESTLLGGTGDDTLFGGDEDDTLDGGDGEDAIFGGAGEDQLTGGDDDDHLAGGADKDTITGGAGADFIDGGTEDDTINITGDEAEFDSINGGADIDTVQVLGSKSVTLALFDATANGIEAIKGNDEAILGNKEDNLLDFTGITIGNVDFIDGGDGNDVINGSLSADNIRGGKGDDVLKGGDEDDTLNGGAGIDDLQGGNGDDIFVFVGTEAQFDTINGDAGADNTVRVDGTASVTLNKFDGTTNNIDTWQGNSKGVLGDAFNNTLNFTNVATLKSTLPFVDGAAGNDTITASADGMDIRGGAGDDTLNGAGGQDTINGGAGNDTIVAGANDDTIQITGTEAEFDTLDGGAGASDTIEVLGGAAVKLNGFAATGIEFWSGNKKGVVGNDFGNVLDFSGLTNAGDVGAIDGAGGNDTITGSKQNDDIRGGIGNDTLNGDIGNDILTGGSGADIVNGGLGDDTIVIAGTDGQFDVIDGGDDTDTLSLTGSSITLNGLNTLDAGSDLEVLVGKNTAILGNAASNKFDLSALTSVTGLKSIDAGAGNDEIIGVDLSDVVDDLRGNAGNDELTGGKGNDKLAGGSGNDTFFFTTADFGKDTISDYGSGFDVLDFTGNFADENAVLAAADQVGTGVVITLDSSNTVTLQNYTLAQLEAAATGGLILP